MRCLAVGFILLLALGIPGCRTAPPPGVRDAERFDYQTRYRVREASDGFRLTVYVNARGRPIDRAAVATLDRAVLRVAESIAENAERRIHPFAGPAAVSTQTDIETNETYWVAEQRARWAD